MLHPPLSLSMDLGLEFPCPSAGETSACMCQSFLSVTLSITSSSGYRANIIWQRTATSGDQTVSLLPEKVRVILYFWALLILQVSL